MIKQATFAERLQNLLSMRSISRSQLSRLIGIDRSNITRYCSGEYEAKGDVVYAIAEKLHVNPAWLMGLDAPMDPDAGDPFQRLQVFALDAAIQELGSVTAEEIELVKLFRDIPDDSHAIILSMIRAASRKGADP